MVVRQRQEQTLEWAWDMWGGTDDTENYAWHRAQPWSWVPTVQGRTIEQYVWHAEQLRPLLKQQMLDYQYVAYALDLGEGDAADATRAWAVHAADASRVAIGSLCGRNSALEVREAIRVVAAVAEVLPGVRLHLWGVKLTALRQLTRAGLMPRIESFDTAAHNSGFASGLEVRKAEMRALGLSQRAHALQVALPRYQRRVAGVLAQPALL